MKRRPQPTPPPTPDENMSIARVIVSPLEITTSATKRITYRASTYDPFGSKVYEIYGSPKGMSLKLPGTNVPNQSYPMYPGHLYGEDLLTAIRDGITEVLDAVEYERKKAQP